MSALPCVTRNAPVTVAACSAPDPSIGTMAMGSVDAGGLAAGAGTPGAGTASGFCAGTIGGVARSNARTKKLPRATQWRRGTRTMRLGQKAKASAVTITRDLHLHEIANHLPAALGQHAFGVELHSLDGQALVPQPHDH